MKEDKLETIGIIVNIALIIVFFAVEINHLIFLSRFGR